MTWIESHDELPTHPKTLKAARRLKVCVPQVIGHLHVLWYWCLTHRPDGRLEGMDADDIADAAGWPDDGETFVAGLVAAGWLDDEDGTLFVHDWWDHAGQTVARRTKATAEQRDSGRLGAHRRWHVREGKVDPTCVHCKDDVPPPSDLDGDPNGVPNGDPMGSDDYRDRDKNLTLVGTADAVTDEDDRFEQFWDAYPRHHETNLKGGGGNKKTTRRRFGKLKRADQDEVLAAVGPYASVCLPGGRFPKNAERFLTDEFWKTYLEMPNPADDDEFVGGVRRVR